MLYEEVDYTREGKNAERFSENFKGTEWIKAPGINWSRSTSKVRTSQCQKKEKRSRAAAGARCSHWLLPDYFLPGWWSHVLVVVTSTVFGVVAHTSHRVQQ